MSEGDQTNPEEGRPPVRRRPSQTRAGPIPPIGVGEAPPLPTGRGPAYGQQLPRPLTLDDRLGMAKTVITSQRRRIQLLIILGIVLGLVAAYGGITILTGGTTVTTTRSYTTTSISTTTTTPPQIIMTTTHTIITPVTTTTETSSTTTTTTTSTTSTSTYSYVFSWTYTTTSVSFYDTSTYTLTLAVSYTTSTTTSTTTTPTTTTTITTLIIPVASTTTSTTTTTTRTSTTTSTDITTTETETATSTKTTTKTATTSTSTTVSTSVTRTAYGYYDGFASPSLSNLWIPTNPANIAIANGNCTIGNGASIKLKQSVFPSVDMKARISFTPMAHGNQWWGLKEGSNWVAYRLDGTTSRIYASINAGGTPMEFDMGPLSSFSGQYIYEIKYFSQLPTPKVQFFIGPDASHMSLRTEYSTSVPSGPLPATFEVSGDYGLLSVYWFSLESM